MKMSPSRSFAPQLSIHPCSLTSEHLNQFSGAWLKRGSPQMTPSPAAQPANLNSTSTVISSVPFLIMSPMLMLNASLPSMRMSGYGSPLIWLPMRPPPITRPASMASSLL